MDPFTCSNEFQPLISKKSKKSKKKSKSRKHCKCDQDDSSSFVDVDFTPGYEALSPPSIPVCPFVANDEGADGKFEEKGVVVKHLYEGPRRCGCCTNWVSEPPAAVSKRVEKTSAAKHALTVYYLTNKTGDDTSFDISSINVRSEQLKEFLKDVLEDFTIGRTNYTLRPPFKSLFFHWDALVCKMESCFDPVTREHVQALFDIVNKGVTNIIKDRDNLVPRGLITYDLLWTLYPRKSMAFCPLDGTAHIMKIKTPAKVFSFENSGCETEHTEIELTHEDWPHGTSRAHTVSVNRFAGTLAITDLPAIPYDLHPEAGSLTKALVERGRRALSIQDGSCWIYSGFAKMGCAGATWVDGRIIVDQAEFSKIHSDPSGLYRASSPHLPEGSFPDDAALSLRDPCAPNEEADETPEPENEWQLARCRSVVRGFSLSTKIWASFEVDNISDMVWNDQAFDQLVMSNRRKRMIHALVERNQKQGPRFDDFIQGKGQGLIMLLQGPPGTGKTLTAQSIADKMHLPLYTVHASELPEEGNDVQVEEALARLLQRAEHWNAVLLMDEADAFLETRDNAATARSKRVAVFLRELENFTGIMLLTTNRPIHFDEAFHSRIDMTLSFADLDASARSSVWKTFLRRLPNNVHDADVALLARPELNGRQIKNTVKMAVLLAEHEGQTLNMEHFGDVFEVMGVCCEEPKGGRRQRARSGSFESKGVV
ncbi:hypothetical protein MBLNU230_g6561t1 [Neophaeotheca triangularis]